MKLSRLKNYCCPCCNDVLIEKPEGYLCSQGKFFISKEKFDAIVSDLYKGKKISGDNLSALNNLGHKKVKGDFSDSKFL